MKLYDQDFISLVNPTALIHCSSHINSSASIKHVGLECSIKVLLANIAVLLWKAKLTAYPLIEIVTPSLKSCSKAALHEIYPLAVA